MGPTTPIQKARLRDLSFAPRAGKAIMRPLRLQQQKGSDPIAGNGPALTGVVPLHLPPPPPPLRDANSQEPHFQEPQVRLNVSGSVFVVSPSTLTRREPGSIFADELRKSPGHSGDIDINRSPKLFLEILNYLRTGQVNKGASDLDALLDEARFYGCTSMATKIEQRLRRKTCPKPPPTPPSTASCRQEDLRAPHPASQVAVNRSPMSYLTPERHGQKVIEQSPMRKIASQEDMLFDMDL